MVCNGTCTKTRKGLCQVPELSRRKALKAFRKESYEGSSCLCQWSHSPAGQFGAGRNDCSALPA